MEKNDIKSIASKIMLLVLCLIAVFLIMDRLNKSGWGKSSGIFIVVLIGSLVISRILSVVVHESGHLVMGLLTGYKFVSFRVGNLTLVKHNGKPVFRKDYAEGTLGQCLMTRDIPQKDEDIPYFWYNVGGGLFNLLMTALSCVVLSNVTNRYVKAAFIIFVVFSLYCMIVNLVPFGSNDGANILEMSRSPQARRLIIKLLIINERRSKGETLDEMPDSLFETDDLLDTKYDENMTMTLAFRELERRDLAAAKSLYSALSYNENTSDALRNEAGCEKLFCDIMTGESSQTIDESYEGLKKYIELTSKTSLSRRRLMFAYYYIYKQDKESADKEYDLAVKLSNNLAILGEAKAEMSLIEYVKEKSLM